MFEGMTREEFLGNPTIIPDDEATISGRPSKHARAGDRVEFMEGLTAFVDHRECVVFDGDTVVAFHRRFQLFMNTIVYEEKYRGRGIATEMIFRVSMLNGQPLPGGSRTAKNFRCCERAWDKIEAWKVG